MTHRFHRKQNRLLLLRLSNKNKVRKSTGAHRQQVTRRHLHQSPCGRPAGSGCAPPPPVPTDSCLLSGSQGVGASCGPHLAGPEPSVPSFLGQDGPQHACSQLLPPSLHPSARGHLCKATRPASPLPVAHAHTGPGSLPKQLFPRPGHRWIPG